MNERDDAIDTVMAALRAATPSAGFEARIYHALQQAALPTRTLRLPFVMMASAASLLCAMAVGLGLHTLHDERAVTAAKPQPSALMPAHPTESEVAVVKRLTPMHTAPRVRAERPLRVDFETVRPHENIPPPPLPLTQEEKLAIRIMRHNDLPQLATLSTDARTISLHADAESYREFFAPRPALNGQPNYEQHIISGGSQ